MAKRKDSTSPTLDLSVTEEIIQRAVKGNSGGCLIADAIKSQYPQFTGITVDMATVRVSDKSKGLRYTYLTPPKAQHMLLSFDQGWPTSTDSVRIRNAVKVTKIVRTRQHNRNRDERFAELETKEKLGTLTGPERQSLARMRKTNAKATPPDTYGEAEVEVTPQGRAVVVGGRPLKQGAAHPNLLRGRNRHFGAKLADPGDAFREAVNEAVAAKMGELPVDEA